MALELPRLTENRTVVTIEAEATGASGGFRILIIRVWIKNDIVNQHGHNIIRLLNDDKIVVNVEC